MPPLTGSSIDGYSLIKKIGEGGFGEVWLSQTDATGAWKALKWISKSSVKHLDQELSALSRYSNSVRGIRSPHLVPIEHIRLLDEALIYVMPLADGFDGLPPEDLNWKPMSLRGVMERHFSDGTWFGLDEIKKLIVGVLKGAALIAEAGMQHRDIKPENILFIGGEPALADFGLAAEDKTIVSVRGTPWHMAPSWYMESGGNADQWCSAILLYQLLTGNAPDKIGKPKYLRPAAGMGNLKGESLAEWKRLHQFIFRASSESPKERFQGAEAFYKAIESDSREKSVKPSSRLILTSLMGLTLLVLAVGYWMIERHKSAPLVAKNIPAVPAMLSTTLTSASRPEWMDHPKHIYSKAEVKLLNRFIAENNQAAIEKLKSDNEARYRELIKKLPPGAGFSWVEEKMRFPENP